MRIVSSRIGDAIAVGTDTGIVLDRDLTYVQAWAALRALHPDADPDVLIDALADHPS